jgi:hypothetical protein
MLGNQEEKMKCFGPLGIGFTLLSAVCANALAATYKDDIGFTALQAQLGISTPTGNGVQVSHVEAPDSSGNYFPDTSSSEFTGKTFFGYSGLSGASGHATSVGQLFYGNSSSIAPNIGAIDAYDANHWLGGGLINYGSTQQPLITSARVTNHSWVGFGSTSENAGILQRIDWLVETDESIQVAAMNNGSSNQPLLGSAYNVIAVGRTDGEHAQGSVAINDTYGSGRTRPDIVAPQSTTSGATPVVAAAAALLVEKGHAMGGTSTTNRAGQTIYNGERSEVVKATLMAGADRVTNNLSTSANITDYRANAANQTTNGLDTRFGAGQVNIQNSYHILAGGEQNSLQDSGAGSILWNGFDYDPAFGGAGGSNDAASYTFTADATHNWLTASLVWNIDINGGTSTNFDGTATLYNFDLMLFDVTSGSSLVGSSMSTNENTENLWLSLTSGHSYLMQVIFGGTTTFNWDYALAWRISGSPFTAAPVPLPATFWLLISALLGMTGFRRKV